jgi:hypothetical protein
LRLAGSKSGGFVYRFLSIGEWHGRDVIPNQTRLNLGNAVQDDPPETGDAGGIGISRLFKPMQLLAKDRKSIELPLLTHRVTNPIMAKTV